jgi:hypothetical protein
MDGHQLLTDERSGLEGVANHGSQRRTKKVPKIASEKNSNVGASARVKIDPYFVPIFRNKMLNCAGFLSSGGENYVAHF